MKLIEAIKEMKGTKQQKELASDIGMQAGALGTIVKRNNMQVKTLIAIANACGYEVVVRPKDGLKKSERTYVIDNAEKPTEE